MKPKAAPMLNYLPVQDSLLGELVGWRETLAVKVASTTAQIKALKAMDIKPEDKAIIRTFLHYILDETVKQYYSVTDRIKTIGFFRRLSHEPKKTY